MSDKTQRQVRTQLDQLRQLFATRDAVVAEASGNVIDQTQVLALGAVLHSFYTGVENILKRIALDIDGSVPRGKSWHREFLAVMAAPTADRQAVISSGTNDLLREYL